MFYDDAQESPHVTESKRKKAPYTIISEVSAFDTIVDSTIVPSLNQATRMPRLNPCVNKLPLEPPRPVMHRRRVGCTYEARVYGKMVGLPGFEPGSNAPKASSIDQTNPQARE